MKKEILKECESCFSDFLGQPDEIFCPGCASPEFDEEFEVEEY